MSKDLFEQSSTSWHWNLVPVFNTLHSDKPDRQISNLYFSCKKFSAGLQSWGIGKLIENKKILCLGENIE